MKNKKTILIVLLAAILAFIAAFFIFVILNKKPAKHAQNTIPNQQETTIKESTAGETLPKIEEKQGEVTNEQPPYEAPQKVIQKKQVVKKDLKKAAPQKLYKETIKPVIQKVELQQAEKSQEEGIVIPIE